MNQVSITLTGKDLSEVGKRAIEFGEVLLAQTGSKKATKKAAPMEEELDDAIEEATEETIDDLEASADTDDMGFDDEVEEAPKKSAKTKTAKLTEKDVNTAALAHARKHTRPKTLALLKSKFKVSSISELKPEQYGKVIEALKV